MLTWRRGWGQSAMGICALCYMKHIWCNGFPEIYAQLEEGVGSVGHGILLYVKHGYMCIVHYVRLMGCNSVAWIHGQLEGEV